MGEQAFLNIIINARYCPMITLNIEQNCISVEDHQGKQFRLLYCKYRNVKSSEDIFLARSPTAMIVSWTIARRGTGACCLRSGHDGRRSVPRRGWSARSLASVHPSSRDDTSTSGGRSGDRGGDPLLRANLSIYLAARSLNSDV